MTDTRNGASISVAERLDMQAASTVHTTFKGEPCEERTYQITRAEWEARTSPSR